MKKLWNKLDDSIKGQLLYALMIFIVGLLILGTNILIGIFGR